MTPTGRSASPTSPASSELAFFLLNPTLLQPNFVFNFVFFCFSARYLVFANAITAAYSVASILLSSIKSFARYDWLIFLLDQVRFLPLLPFQNPDTDSTRSVYVTWAALQAAAYLLVTSCSAAAELVYLAREGDKEVSWGEVCSYFGRFCGRATVSVALQGAALLCFVVLSLGSAFRVFSKCDAPCRPGAAAGSKQPEGQFAY